ncbi:MAG TPA: RodZ domain-containing protein [Nitrospirota bacterium]|nr:RodZ domain-containing protein [Nitrospirota bacterium]
MSTLGPLLREARTARGIDLREAAQQTRISLQYLQALEDEDFAKLPGEVFVKGFLKNYSRFLQLDETLVMQKYGELAGQKPEAPAAAPASPVAALPKHARPEQESEPTSSSKLPIEPFIWGAGIIAFLIVFLFVALPSRRSHKTDTQPHAPLTAATTTTLAAGPTSSAPKAEKLYLEVAALENTWILVRTDASPQKKATLVKGESLTWSADERFIVSYGSAGALKLVLNGRELTVDEPKNAVVRDMTIIAAGIINKKITGDAASQPKPRPRTAPSGTMQPQVQRKPGEGKPVSAPAGSVLPQIQRKSVDTNPTLTPSAPPPPPAREPERRPGEERPVSQPIAPLFQ